MLTTEELSVQSTAELAASLEKMKTESDHTKAATVVLGVIKEFEIRSNLILSAMHEIQRRATVG